MGNQTTGTIEEVLKKESIKEVFESLFKDSNFKEVREKAAFFLNKIIKFGALPKITGKYENILSFQSTYKSLKQYQNNFSEVISAQLQFEASWNLFRKIAYGLIFMNDANDIYVFSQTAIGKFFSDYVTQSSKGERGQISSLASSSEQAQKRIEELQNESEVFEILQTRLNERKKETINILNVAIARKDNLDPVYKNIREGKKDNSLKNTFYWWVNINKGENITNSRKLGAGRGFIVEGYLNALINDKLNGGINFTQPVTNMQTQDAENVVGTLGYYVDQTDNTGAIKQQDIIKKFNDIHFQFASKSGKFSLESIGQFIPIALVIINFQSNFSTNEEILDAINEKDINLTAVQILKDGQEKIESKIKEILSSSSKA